MVRSSSGLPGLSAETADAAFSSFISSLGACLGLERVDRWIARGGEFHLPSFVLLGIRVAERFGVEVAAEDPFLGHDRAAGPEPETFQGAGLVLVIERSVRLASERARDIRGNHRSGRAD